MDRIRTCYRAKMRTIEGEDPVEVVWYRVPESNPWYTGPNVFRSRFWCKEPFNDGIGEQSAGRVCCDKRDVDYYKGMKPLGASTGALPCGSDAVAANGAGPGDPTFLTNSLGSAPCCNPVPLCPAYDLTHAGVFRLQWEGTIKVFATTLPGSDTWRGYLDDLSYLTIFCFSGLIFIEFSDAFFYPVFADSYGPGYAHFTLPNVPEIPPVRRGQVVELWWPNYH